MDGCLLSTVDAGAAEAAEAAADAGAVVVAVTVDEATVALVAEARD